MANYWHILTVKRSDGVTRYQIVRAGEVYPFDYSAYEDAVWQMNSMNSFESLMADLDDAYDACDTCDDYDAPTIPFEDLALNLEGR